MNSTPADSKSTSVKEPVAEQIMDSIQGKDEPMEVSHPEAPPLLVFASYPIVLLLGLIIAFAVFWMSRG